MKDESKLPPRAYYTEPRDLTKFYPVNGEHLNSFISRISSYRDSKDYPVLSHPDLRVLVVSSLEKTCNPRLIKSFFITKSILPQFSQLTQVASTLVSQIGSSPVCYNVRQERASKCLKCNFHPKSRSINKALTSVLGKALDVVTKSENLENLVSSEEEKALGVCGVCGCDLKLKIKVSLDAALKNMTTPQLSKLLSTYGPRAFDICWILNESLADYNAKTYLKGRMTALPEPLCNYLKDRSSSAYTKSTKKLKD